MLAELRRQVAEEWGDPEAVVTVDETGFPKKGTKSVGVKRQYSGTLGRVENCQVGVFLGYHAAKGHTLLDRRLFLPEEWAADRPRRTAAGVPAGRDLPHQAGAGPGDGGRRGRPAGCRSGGWRATACTGTARRSARGSGRWASGTCWTRRPTRGCGRAEPEVIPPGRKPARGRATTRPKVATKPVRVDEVVAGLPASAWRRVTVAEGSQGPLIYEYAEVTAWFSEEGLPSGPERLLVRRSLGQEPEVKYHRTNAPAEVPWRTVAGVRSKRWSIEQDFQNGKGECGLDEYETRGWVGWHHHTALSVLALWFLARQRDRSGGKNPGLTVPEVRAVLVHLLDRRAWDEDEILRWSDWRRERNRRAAESHRKRRAKLARRQRKTTTGAVVLVCRQSSIDG